jgi:uncharacterized OB-fold protein
MKLLFIACTECGAPNTSPFGMCPDCESRQVAARVAKRRIRSRAAVRSKRAA